MVSRGSRRRRGIPSRATRAVLIRRPHLNRHHVVGVNALNRDSSVGVGVHDAAGRNGRVPVQPVVVEDRYARPPAHAPRRAQVVDGDRVGALPAEGGIERLDARAPRHAVRPPQRRGEDFLH